MICLDATLEAQQVHPQTTATIGPREGTRVAPGIPDGIGAEMNESTETENVDTTVGGTARTVTTTPWLNTLTFRDAILTTQEVERVGPMLMKMATSSSGTVSSGCKDSVWSTLTRST